MFIVEKGRVRAFAKRDGRERNLAFYREGDYFGELSVLNGSERAASAEALADTRLLALQPNVARELEKQFPEFRRLIEERLAQYRANTEARVPLDLATELLPAEAAVQNKVELDTDETHGRNGDEPVCR
jgi:CRP-like cAMP-binding protein